MGAATFSISYLVLGRIGAAAFSIPYMVLGRQFYYQALAMTQMEARILFALFWAEAPIQAMVLTANGWLKQPEPGIPDRVDAPGPPPTFLVPPTFQMKLRKRSLSFAFLFETCSLLSTLPCNPPETCPV